MPLSLPRLLRALRAAARAFAGELRRDASHSGWRIPSSPPLPAEPAIFIPCGTREYDAWQAYNRAQYHRERRPRHSRLDPSGIEHRGIFCSALMPPLMETGDHPK